MRIYLAGPMRGYDLFNFPAFFAASITLRKLGHDVSNPAEYDMSIGLNPALALDSPNQIPFDMHDTLSKDFLEVLAADAIVFLPGWEKSTGAQAEYVVAYFSGKEIYFWCDESLVSVPRIKPLIEIAEHENSNA